MPTHQDELLSEKIDQLTRSLDALKEDVKPLIQIAPILQEYVELRGSVITWKNLVVGFASLLMSIGTIGAGTIWLIKYIRHGT